LCDQETSNEEAKARYAAVENATKKGYNAKETNNKQHNQQGAYTRSQIHCFVTSTTSFDLLGRLQ